MTTSAHSASFPARAGGQARRLCCWFALPSLLYIVAFSAMTWPAITSFDSRFFCDTGDGLQNVWNIWWVRKAIVELHQLPWHTTWLHHPGGTTLLGQTLNPFNGLIAILFEPWLSPVQVHNVAVLGGFVLGGWSAFLLAYDATHAYLPSLLGGFAFTFSGYHFAHAEGHLQLVSLQFIPLFLLCWLRLLRGPSVRRALGAAGILWLVILCDYYYFAYCVGIGAVSLALQIWRHRRRLPNFVRRIRRPVAVFAFAALLTSGALVAALLWKSAVDPFSGSHDPLVYSTDALAPFLPGGHSAWGHLTESYWTKLRGNIHESSVYLGVVVLALAAWGLARGSTRRRDALLWPFLAIGALVLSYGPVLTCRGAALTGRWLPYQWLEAFVPPLRMSGCPGRMMVIVALAVSVLATSGLAAVLRTPTPTRRSAAVLIALATAIDLWPRAMTLSHPEVPSWVQVVKGLPGPGALLDLSGTAPSMALYYQTIHERPMALGYISRAPKSVLVAREHLNDDIRNERFQTLRDRDGFRYVVVRTMGVRLPGAVFDDAQVNVVDLARLQLAAVGH